jgi:hypothetical protein
MIGLLPYHAQQATVPRFECPSLDIPQPVTVNDLIPDAIYSKAKSFFVFCHLLCALLPAAQNCDRLHIPGLRKGSSAALPSTVCVPNRLPVMACARRPNNKRVASAARYVTSVARAACWPGGDDGCGRNAKRRLPVVAPVGTTCQGWPLVISFCPCGVRSSQTPRRRREANVTRLHRHSHSPCQWVTDAHKERLKIGG